MAWRQPIGCSWFRQASLTSSVSRSCSLSQEKIVRPETLRLALMCWLSFSCMMFTAGISGCRPGDRYTHTLIFISPHRDEIRYEAAQGFSRWLVQQPGWEQARVQFVWRDIGGGTSQIFRYLDAQYQTHPHTAGIDILWGGGTDIYLDLKKKGLLEHCPLPAEVLQFLGPGELAGIELRDPDGYWYGCMLTTLGIFYHLGVLHRLGLSDWQPRRWWDLTDERLAGHVSAGDPRLSGSVHLLYEWILQVYGWERGMELLMRLGANTRAFARSSDSVSRDVVIGKAACAGTLDFYALTALAREHEQLRRRWAESSQLRLVFPAGETILNPDSIAILKGAPHKELARLFVIWSLSEVGQQTWMLEPIPTIASVANRSQAQTDTHAARQLYPGAPVRYRICRLSIAEKLYDPQKYPPQVRSVPINPFQMVRSAEAGKNLRRYDNRLAESRRRALDDLVGAWILDTHPQLRAAWEVIRSLPPDQRGPLEKQLFAPPCSEAQLLAWRSELADPRRRIALQADWLHQALSRYRTLRNRAVQLTKANYTPWLKRRSQD